MRVELKNGHWRPMTTTDTASVSAIADRVHASYPEDDAVFLERLRLYPEGCAMPKLRRTFSSVFTPFCCPTTPTVRPRKRPKPHTMAASSPVARSP